MWKLDLTVMDAPVKIHVLCIFSTSSPCLLHMYAEQSWWLETNTYTHFFLIEKSTNICIYTYICMYIENMYLMKLYKKYSSFI